MKAYILFMITMLSCQLTSAQNKAIQFKLIVNTKGFYRQPALYLAYQIDGRKIIDSAKYDLNKDVFVFLGNIDKPLQATVVADYDNKGLPEFIQKAKSGAKVDQLKIYLHQGTINLSAISALSNGQITGSSINTDYLILNRLLAPITEQKNIISNQFKAGLDHVAANLLNRQIDSLGIIEKHISWKFIQDHSDSYYSLISLAEYGGSSLDEDHTTALYNGLSNEIRNTSFGKKFGQYLKDDKTLIIGTKAPEFTQNDTAGRPISLSNFRGKYVLLNFWASWCGPCRDENPYIRELYQNFKNRYFTILGVSLDGADGKAAWIKAINDDNLMWTQVSDLKHWNNKVSTLFCVTAIPKNFLIDPNGIIIGKSLDFEELKGKLEELLPKQ
ncbi:MAG: AhpC/TSA family protein [Bacteroidota bacterium]